MLNSGLCIGCLNVCGGVMADKSFFNMMIRCMLKGEKQTDKKKKKWLEGSVDKGTQELLWINLGSVQLEVKVRMKYRGS